MSDTAISIENVSKSYRLGVIGSGTLREDLQSWWHRKRGLPDPNLRVDQLHQAVEGHTLWALQNVSLEIKQGEVWGIIGRNGAGKSTLLKILSRVTAPTSGRIRVKGRVASLLEVGTGFHPELTGRENIFLNGAILGMTKAEVAQKLDEIIDFSEIEQFIDTPVKRYSSGMYVRLAFAVAAHLEPEILVVDEVLAVGDVEFQKKCLGKMGDVAGEGRTILFVSHNMAAVQNLCEKGALIQRGQLAHVGPAGDVIESYLGGRAESMAVSVADRTDREGKGEVRFVRMNFLDSAGRSVSSIPCGERLTLELAYVARQALSDLVVYVGIYDLMDTQLINLNTQMTGESITVREGNGVFRCEIPELPLPAGEYRVNIGIGERHGRFLDRIISAAPLIVSSADFFGSGYSHPGSGKFYLRHRWSQADGTGEG
jgi:lipopolysaccharide transport system ATP-binding protein